MADYGIQVFNGDGDVQIDGVHENYFLHYYSKGSWTARSAKNGTSDVVSHKDVSFPTITTDEPPIICAVGKNRYVAAGPTGRVGAWSGARLIAAHEEGEGTVDYELHVYVRLRDASFRDNSDYGIQVFSESGMLVFDSRYYPMRVVGSSQVTDASEATRRNVGNNVVPDIQLFGSVHSFYSGGGTSTVSDRLNRMMAYQSGGTTYTKSMRSAFDTYTASHPDEVPVVIAVDALSSFYGGRQYSQISKKPPFSLVKNLPF